jgi:hypothetical protein
LLFEHLDREMESRCCASRDWFWQMKQNAALKMYPPATVDAHPVAGSRCVVDCFAGARVSCIQPVNCPIDLVIGFNSAILFDRVALLFRATWADIPPGHASNA